MRPSANANSVTIMTNLPRLISCCVTPVNTADRTPKKILYERTEPRPVLRRKSNIWNARRRAVQSMRCRYRRPWLHATGPRSDAGRARSSMNAYRHGMRSHGYRMICDLLRRQRDFVRGVIARSKIRTQRLPKLSNCPFSPDPAGRNGRHAGDADAPCRPTGSTPSGSTGIIRGSFS